MPLVETDSYSDSNLEVKKNSPSKSYFFRKWNIKMNEKVLEVEEENS